jgi:hypothetical protein
MATSKELARLEARIDSLSVRVDQLRNEASISFERMSKHIDGHAGNWLLHRGTMFGAMGPILVGIIEVVRHFVF